MNEMYLVLGDYSHDGHGKSDKVRVGVNKLTDEVRLGYIKSCELTGVSFNHNQDFTKRNRSWEERKDYTICTEYEESEIPEKALEVLKSFDTKDELKTILTEGRYLDDSSFVALWFWFVKLSIPDLQWWRILEDNTLPCINGQYSNVLPVQFGYGLYA